MASEFVPEGALDYGETLRRGGHNCGDEDFALFQCPACGQVYLLDYEVDTVYLDGTNLTKRALVVDAAFSCVTCGREVPSGRPWAGPHVAEEFQVTWAQVARSNWAWAIDELQKQR